MFGVSKVPVHHMYCSTVVDEYVLTDVGVSIAAYVVHTTANLNIYCNASRGEANA